jgi:hypothetical protein
MSTHFLGDSNVVRYLPKYKLGSTDPVVQATELTKATNSVLLQDALSNPKAAHSILIVSAITNLITSKFFDDFDSMIDHCKTVFNDFMLWVQEGRNSLDGFADQVYFPFSIMLVTRLSLS